MNARVFELINRPEIVTKEDILILQKEVDKFPFMQSLRTLYLSAIYQFDTENYPKELSKTAAYTTDKKILYQFINFKKETEKKEAVKFKKINLVKDSESITHPVENKDAIANTEFLNNLGTNASVEIANNDVEPPILEQKENEFQVIQEDIDLELETQIFAELAAQEEKEKEVFRTREEDLNFSKETLLEHLDQIKETHVTPAEISFNAFDSFLPDVKFSVPSKKENFSENENPNIITEEKAQEILLQNENNFDQVQEFIINSEPISKEEIIVEIKTNEVPEISEEILDQEIVFDWKPMGFVQNTLDAHIKISEKTKLQSEELVPQKNIIPIAKPVEITPISELEVEDNIDNSLEKKLNLDQEAKASDKEENPSNIPNFVNTWQNWLKIDRKESQKFEEAPSEIHPEKSIEKKAVIIDKFIEENPKISQLKEDAHYEIKEKTDDISHLVTETLAKLYTSQRLYTKAINAYEILKKKHPEKATEFQLKILEIKDKQGK